MGFERASVEAALHLFGSEEAALNHLLGQPNENTANAAEGTNLSEIHGTDSSLGAAEVEGRSDAEGPLSQSEAKIRDVEMEDEITEELQNADAYSDYDIEVTKEGEAIAEYLALLSSAQNA
ncbi:hypothetical protein CDL12_07003 [Handroanthus impetiginosus]|uniref:UBA domain-containing protein n=1 Tax=Handroanthus impetiginosus TaxID=429701 RepID=A0A2G9HS98_9LAMI|nr:hypothetical protein CDL12_07003 [Handroanthus impetiginosus]